MKFETLLLRGMLIACSLVCAMILGAMVKTMPPSVQSVSGRQVSQVLLAAPTNCVLPPDGLVCPRLRG